MTVSSYARKSKLKYQDIQDLILGEDVCRRVSGEASWCCFKPRDKG